MKFQSTYYIHTSDQVSLEIELAGIGNRIFANAIDFFINALLLALVYYIVFASAQINREFSQILWFVLPFILFFGYHFLQEWLWNGKTIGKYLLKIRAVRQNGQPLGFWESFGRNLFRLVDVYVSGIGMIPILFSPKEKRFGDFLAGTVVINDQSIPYPGSFLPGMLPDFPDQMSDTFHSAIYRLIREESASEEYALIEQFLNRQQTLLPAAREQLRQELTAYFQERMALPEEQVPADLLEKVHAAFYPVK